MNPAGAATPRRGFAAVAALVAAVALVYANALDGPFQFDDWWAIAGNPSIASLGAWWEALPGIRPLLKLSLALNQALWPTPRGFHAVNVLVHAGNAVLLFLLLRRWLPTLAPRAAAPGFVAFAAALLFALHPAATEAVTYVSGRSISLMALFFLASLLTLTRAENQMNQVHLMSVVLFAGALAVRETAVVMPLAWLLYARCAGHAWGDALRPLRAHGLVLLLALAAAAATPGYHSFLGWSLQTRELGPQLLGQLEAHAYLLTHPLPGGWLDIDPDLRVPAAFAPRHALVLLFYGALAALAWHRRKSSPWVAFAFGWYLLQLAPSNSLLPRFDLANDRHLYLALVAPALAMAIGLGRIPSRALAAAALVVLALLAGAATVRRNHDYRSELALWQATVATSPAKARPRLNLGHARDQAGDPEGARRAYLCALSLDPGRARDQAAVNLLVLEGRHAFTAPPDRPCDPP